MDMVLWSIKVSGFESDSFGFCRGRCILSELFLVASTSVCYRIFLSLWFIARARLFMCPSTYKYIHASVSQWMMVLWDYQATSHIPNTHGHDNNIERQRSYREPQTIAEYAFLMKIDRHSFMPRILELRLLFEASGWTINVFVWLVLCGYIIILLWKRW